MTGARRRTVMALVLAVVLAGPATAFDPFRVTYTADRSRPESVTVSGRVVNEGRADALDVYVTAQALDATGRVVANGVTFVSSLIPPGGAAAYVARIPTVPGVVAFRVSVSSFRSGFSQQAG
ncbi:MAG: hypothetical protein HY216_15950 [Candidatus Rokubacteria bacterium]|nr:hypothetical protein [Candidatus Rokubacteria bacterium]